MVRGDDTHCRKIAAEPRAGQGRVNALKWIDGRGRNGLWWRALRMRNDARTADCRDRQQDR